MFPAGRAIFTWPLVAVVSTAVAIWRVAPVSWRPRGAAIPTLAAVLAYLSLDLGFRTGFVQWLDHDVFERLRGGVDDIATWLVAAVGAAVAVAAVALIEGGRH